MRAREDSGRLFGRAAGDAAGVWRGLAGSSRGATAGRAVLACLTVSALLAVPLAASGAETTLPSEMCRGVFIVPLSLNGTAFDFLLDTGSSWTFIDPAAFSSRLEQSLASRKVSFATARIGTLELGPLEARAYPLTTLSRALGRKVDGILGFSELRDVLLTLDYPAGRITVRRGALPRADGVNVLRDVGGKRPWVKLRVGDRVREFQIDSGATPGHLQLLARDRVRWAVEPRPARVTTLFGGSVVDRGGRLEDSVTVGPLRFERPVTFVAERERQIGWQIMRHFSWTFDQKNDRIAVRGPAAAEAVPSPPYVTRGFGVRPRREGLEVVRVLEGTPAELAGLRAGDLITGIDGVPVGERGCGDALGPEADAPLSLSFVRDGSELEVTIRTATLIP